MKHPEIPGATPGNVLRLAEPRLTNDRPADETPALPKAHENDFGADALATARNAEMVRDLLHDRSVIKAHEAWCAAQPRGADTLCITVPDKPAEWRYQTPEGIREVRVAVRAQPAPFARLMGVDIYTELKPGELRPEKAGERHYDKRRVQPMRYRFAGHDDLSREERVSRATLDCIEIAQMKGGVLSLDEVNRIRANHGLEPVANPGDWPNEREPRSLLRRLWVD